MRVENSKYATFCRSTFRVSFPIKNAWHARSRAVLASPRATLADHNGGICESISSRVHKAASGGNFRLGSLRIITRIPHRRSVINRGGCGGAGRVNEQWACLQSSCAIRCLAERGVRHAARVYSAIKRRLTTPREQGRGAVDDRCCLIMAADRALHRPPSIIGVYQSLVSGAATLARLLSCRLFAVRSHPRRTPPVGRRSLA